MSRTLIVADIHGAYDGLMQVFERSGFDMDHDRLICLGDVCDRRTGVKACVEELLKLKQLVMLMGNHDFWTLQWMQEVHKRGLNKMRGSWFSVGPGSSWVNQGGSQTIESYAGGIDESHYRFFSRAKYYHVEDNRLFVHAGIKPGTPLEEQDSETFIWDRELVETAVTANDINDNITGYNAVYLGHTPTLRVSVRDGDDQVKSNNDPDDSASPVLCHPRPAEWLSHGKNMDKLKTGESRINIKGSRWNDFPVRRCEVYLMDTGAGWSNGRLSIMDIDTCEVWQSDPLP